MPRRPAAASAEPSPEQMFDPEELSRERLLVRAVERLARRARADGAAFFDLVMKEERSPKPDGDRVDPRLFRPEPQGPPGSGSRRRIRCAAHQRVVLSFVEHHARCVLRLPAGAGKTYLMGSEALRALGDDPQQRGAVISAVKAGAERVVGLVRDYVENADGSFPELGLVYPDLQPSYRQGDAWKKDALIVDRPPGMRDPSLVAVGVDQGSLPGSRLSWILVDDLVNEENSRTPERRQAIAGWFFSTVLSRDDIGNARIVVANTPWVDGGATPDLTFVLERADWPVLSMDVDGNIWTTNADPAWEPTRREMGADGRVRIVDELRPSRHRDGTRYSRLTAHDAPAFAAHGSAACVPANDDEGGLRPANDSDLETPGVRAVWFDIDEAVPLWPEKWPRAWIEEKRRDYAAQIHRFNQLYLCLCTDEDESPCRVEWIEACKQLAREMIPPVTGLVESYDGPNLVVTGVDLAMGQKRRHHQSCLFTFESTAEGRRRILDVQLGRWKGPEIVDRLISVQTRYRSLIRVESNGGQKYIRDFALERDASLPVYAHYTGEQNKSHSEYGIQAIFAGFANRAWIVPVGPDGLVNPFVQKFLDACLYYQPGAHPPDVIIGAWLACEQERAIRGGRPRGDVAGRSVSAGLLSR